MPESGKLFLVPKRASARGSTQHAVFCGFCDTKTEYREDKVVICANCDGRGYFTGGTAVSIWVRMSGDVVPCAEVMENRIIQWVHEKRLDYGGLTDAECPDTHCPFCNYLATYRTEHHFDRWLDREVEVDVWTCHRCRASGVLEGERIKWTLPPRPCKSGIKE